VVVTTSATVFLLSHLAADPGLVGPLVGLGLLLELIKVFSWHAGWRGEKGFLVAGSVGSVITLSVFVFGLLLNMAVASNVQSLGQAATSRASQLSGEYDDQIRSLVEQAKSLPPNHSSRLLELSDKIESLRAARERAQVHLADVDGASGGLATTLGPDRQWFVFGLAIASEMLVELAIIVLSIPAQNRHSAPVRVGIADLVAALRCFPRMIMDDGSIISRDRINTKEMPEREYRKHLKTLVAAGYVTRLGIGYIVNAKGDT
jgi:hypothetical protein